MKAVAPIILRNVNHSGKLSPARLNRLPKSSSYRLIPVLGANIEDQLISDNSFTIKPKISGASKNSTDKSRLLLERMLSSKAANSLDETKQYIYGVIDGKSTLHPEILDTTRSEANPEKKLVEKVIGNAYKKIADELILGESDTKQKFKTMSAESDLKNLENLIGVSLKESGVKKDFLKALNKFSKVQDPGIYPTYIDKFLKSKNDSNKNALTKVLMQKTVLHLLKNTNSLVKLAFQEQPDKVDRETLAKIDRLGTSLMALTFQKRQQLAKFDVNN